MNAPTTCRRPEIPRPRACLILALMMLCWMVPAAAISIDVQNEAEYTALTDAVRGAEYTRQRYLEGNANPRALVAIVGLWEFAERSPLATPEQLAAFLGEYDAQLAVRIPGDATLSSFGSVLTAVSAVRLPSDGVLEGMDTRVGQRALELLGVMLPGLDNYEQSRLRMSRFDLASVRRLIQRSETVDALTGVLAGVTPTGQRIAGLAQTAANYLTAQGFAPQLGQIDPSAVEINAGLANLPSFAEFVAIRDTPSLQDNLEQEVFSGIDTIQLEGMRLLNEIGTPDVDLGLFLDSLSLTLAASDADDPNHDAAVADLEARRAAIVQSIRNTAAQRASVFARTLLLQQSNFPEARAIATTTRSFAALQLQTNNDLAVAQQGVQIGGSLVGIVAGFATDDPWGAVQSITDVVTGALGLADLLGDGPPSPEQQIFDQIVELRQQVEDMRVQLNGRFDVVDAKLDQIFGTMTTGFAELGDQIGDLQANVDALSASIAESRSSLDRIEDALFGFAQEILLADLSQQTNLVLNYRNNTGADLAYSNSTPSFVASASFFHTFATSTAKGASFAGTPDDQPMVLTLDNAAAVLGGTALARRLNDLRRIPAGLVTSDGTPVNGPITAGRVAAPAPWAQAAAAYAQLARESPWYFAYLLGNQGPDNPNAQINQIIADGQRITGLANATRMRSDLFDALLHRADQGAAAYQDAIIGVMDQELPTGFSDGMTRVDAWGPLGQTVSSLVLPVNTVNWSSPTASGSLTIGSGSFPQHGMEIPTADESSGFPEGTSRSAIAERNALSHLFELGAGQRPQVEMWVNRGTIAQTGGMDLFQIRLDNDSRSDFHSYRTISFTIEVPALGGGWVPLDFVPTGIPAWTYFGFVDRAWPSLRGDLKLGDLTGKIYSTGTIFNTFIPTDSRLRVRQDASSSALSGGTDTFPLQTSYLTNQLATLRTTLRGAVLDEMATPGSILNLAGLRLDNDAALLDAYLGLGMADAMTRSEMLRSAFRGAPSIAGLGFRSSDVLALVLHAAATDSGALGGAPGVGLSTIGPILQDRILGLGIEIAQASTTTAPSFPYVEFVLADLSELRDQASNVAIDETYAIDGPQSIPATQGLLANDIGQAGRIGDEALVVDLAYFSSAEAVPPAHGSISVNEDGAFTYTPEPGFTGTDRFTYRLRASILAANPDVFSAPANVVLRVGVPADRIFADGFE
jgi:hypothetical protein